MSSASPSTTANTQKLADETFMSAGDLRKYMAEMQMAKALSAVNAMDKARAAREELIRSFEQKVEVTPEKIAEVKRNLAVKIRAAIENGANEVMVMRFPNQLCTDSGRAINNVEADWPRTLTGRPRQAYEFWKEHLQPADYKLKAMIIEWPGGFPGDVGFFLSWS